MDELTDEFQTLRAESLKHPETEIFAAPLPPAEAAPPQTMPPKPPFLPRPADPILAPPPIVSPQQPRRVGVDWEQFLGARLFAWLGGLALFIGVAFFIKYSFERNLIPPSLRILLAFTTGAGLVVSGVVLKNKNISATSQTFVASGVVILYAALFGGYMLYGFFGAAFTFAGMAGITVGAFLLAVNMNAQVIALLGMLGGFCAPMLLTPAGFGNRLDLPVLLFAYAALLDLGLLAVGFRRDWTYLILAGAICTAFLELMRGFSILRFEAHPWLLASISTTFNVLFLAGNAWAFAFNRQNSAVRAAAAVLPVFSLLLLLLQVLTGSRAAAVAPLLAMVLTAHACLLAWTGLRQDSLWPALFSTVSAFGIIAIWSSRWLNSSTALWGIAASVAFGLIHGPCLAFLRERGRKARFLAHLGPALVFLLLTQFAVDLRSEQAIALMAATLILTIASLSVALLFENLAAALIALAGSAVTLTSWRLQGFTSKGSDLCWSLGFFLVLTLFPFFRSRTSRLWLTSALAGAFYFWVIFDSARPFVPRSAPGLIPLGLALSPALLFEWHRRHAEPQSKTGLLAWFGGAALFFLTLALPIQFERQWLTLGLAFEGTALLWLYHRVPHAGLKGLGFSLLWAAFLRLAANPMVLDYETRTNSVLNWFLYAYGAVFLCLLIGARLLAPPRNEVLGTNVPPILNALAAIIAFVLMNIEIANHFSAGPYVRFEFSEDFGRDMSYSIGWAIFALALLVIGVRLRLRAPRYASVALLALTLLKLFLHDLGRLQQLYRIGAFIGVAIVLMLASFIYQKFLAPEDEPPSSRS